MIEYQNALLLEIYSLRILLCSIVYINNIVSKLMTNLMYQTIHVLYEHFIIRSSIIINTEWIEVHPN